MDLSAELQQVRNNYDELIATMKTASDFKAAAEKAEKERRKHWRDYYRAMDRVKEIEGRVGMTHNEVVNRVTGVDDNDGTDWNSPEAREFQERTQHKVMVPNAPKKLKLTRQ